MKYYFLIKTEPYMPNEIIEHCTSKYEEVVWLKGFLAILNLHTTDKDIKYHISKDQRHYDYLYQSHDSHPCTI